MSLIPSPELSQSLAALGLQALAHCPTTASDDLAVDGTLILIGPDEPRFWPIFVQSPEYQDDNPDPLDRWSHRVLTALAGQHSAHALFPFGGGPPYQPIFTWALRTGRFWSSPIGFLVHDTAGLFVSFRGALLIPEIHDATLSTKSCLTCVDQPCLSACPVGAFSDGYDVATCKTHLGTSQGADCLTQGCRARRACPVGQGNRLTAQASHHMKAFL
jgi:hypothetical protein